mmetsp:Transcript_72792/g.152002  ORF Transcript_72792/g.152002 Transcript_72792/m.152002 type:complete len:132 (+) Transcript_72792:278-673(+)
MVKTVVPDRDWDRNHILIFHDFPLLIVATTVATSHSVYWLTWEGGTMAADSLILFSGNAVAVKLVGVVVVAVAAVVAIAGLHYFAAVAAAVSLPTAVKWSAMTFGNNNICRLPSVTVVVLKVPVSTHQQQQ